MVTSPSLSFSLKPPLIEGYTDTSFNFPGTFDHRQSFLASPTPGPSLRFESSISFFTLPLGHTCSTHITCIGHNFDVVDSDRL